MGEPESSSEPTLLGQPNLLIGDRPLLLSRSLELLAERVEHDLRGRLNDCQVRPGTVTQTTLMKLCEEPSDIAVVRTDYELAYGLLVTSRSLALSIVEILCGGTGDGEEEDRALSSVETTLMDLVLKPVLDVGVELLELGRGELTFHVAGVNALPDAPPEQALAFALDLTVGSAEGQIILGLTGSQLQDYLERVDRRLAGQVAERRTRPSPGLLRAIRPVPLDLVVGFAVRSVPTRQLADLQVGDVLRTGQAVTRPLEARIGAQRLFTVRPAQRGQRLVAELTGRIDNESGIG